jgi:hypothetical protein
MGIECDGPTYLNSSFSLERDRLRDEALINLGWRLYRAWSIAWFNDEAGERERLRRAIEERIKELKEAQKEQQGQGALKTKKIKDTQSDQKTQEGQTPEVPDLSQEKDLSSPQDQDRARQKDLEVGEGQERAPSERAKDSNPSLKESLPNAPLEEDQLEAEEIPENLSEKTSKPRKAPKLDAALFYSPEHSQELARQTIETIDRLGPAQLKYLASLIAPDYQIKRITTAVLDRFKQVLANSRHISIDSDSEPVYWPEGTPPSKISPFRGLKVENIERAWSLTPYPEKLGLASEALAKTPIGKNPVDYMVATLNIQRLPKTTAAFLENLIKQTEALTKSRLF